MISFLIEGGKFWGGDVGKAGSAVEATGGGTRADGASDLRHVEGVGARLELRRALLGLAGRRVFLARRDSCARLRRCSSPLRNGAGKQRQHDSAAAPTRHRAA